MKAAWTALLSFALAAAPFSAANSQEYYHYHHHHYGLVGGVFGLAGAVVVGAATIVTAPIRILACGTPGPCQRRPADYDERYGYDQRNGGYDGGPAYSREAPEYSGAAEYGYAPPSRFGAPPHYGPDYAPPNEYQSRDYAPRDYDQDYRPEYGPPRRYERGGYDYADAREWPQGPDYTRDQGYDDDGE